MKTMMVMALMGANEQQIYKMLAVVVPVFAAIVALAISGFSSKHSFLGWFARVGAAIVGGVLGFYVGGWVVQPLVTSRTETFENTMFTGAFMLLGGWLAVRVVNQFGRTAPQ